MNTFYISATTKKMSRLITALLTLLFFTVFSSLYTYASDDYGDEHGDDHSEGISVISDETATKSGIKTQAVSAGELHIVAGLFGNVITDPASLSHIRARFDGVISNVTVNLGDKVKQGDTLATVESNESLKRYKVLAPFTGMVIARHANAGELSNGQVLFSIANYDDVWLQLKVFPKQRSAIKAGQSVWLSSAEFTQQSAISHVIPAADDKPYTLAFVKLNNTDGNWPIGALVKAEVATTSKQAAILIPKSAIQQYQSQQVVFVKQGNEYHPRPITVGQADTHNIEVLTGLALNELIVNENSYLIKADLEKSEAGHAH